MACPHRDEGECWGCGVRAKGLQIARPLQAGRVLRPSQVRPMAEDSWAAGKVYDTMPSGERVPLLRNGGRVHIGVKEAAEKRHHIKGQLDQLRNAPKEG